LFKGKTDEFAKRDRLRGGKGGIGEHLTEKS